MRAVIYARYSSDLQRDASMEDQIRLCKERIAREGWTLVQVYRDAAISGGTTLRPGYQAMLEGAREASFDVVVAEALDRLSRDQEDVAALFKRLQFAAIQLVTLAEGEIGVLHIGLKGTMNALFLKDLADKTRRGLRGRVEAGKSGGRERLRLRSRPRLRRERRAAARQPGDQRSRSRDGKGDLFALRRGASPRKIAFDLNARRVRSPRRRLEREHAERQPGARDRPAQK